ncbi:hypothetical protein V2S66_03365 [Streptomyces sp. V4-01]|uniref:C2H2-type domain-containing protein n=1 Tax=Actinacidiphila polyblastidii TaxID=3110430 RepID=A0ABU7P5B5_9ACTN|nr:hypothetical protein [Streptomyces sp. V4-01]
MYRYRCGQCATTSPIVRTRVEMRHERDVHRRRVHGGHIPDGERLQRTVRHPAADRTAVVALVALVAVLFLSVLAGRIA